MCRHRNNKALRNCAVMYQDIMDQETMQSPIAVFKRMYEYKSKSDYGGPDLRVNT